MPHLLQFTAEHREEGLGLQDEVWAFEVELRESVDEIWTDGEVERGRVVNPLDKVAKPDLMQGRDWRVVGP